MTYAYTATERKRVSFGKIPEAMELPNLISVQRESFERFKDEGLREAFKESSPIQSQNHVLEVTFGEHQFGDPAHTVEECRREGYDLSGSASDRRPSYQQGNRRDQGAARLHG